VKGIRSLCGRTLGIIGFGDIGAEVAKRARGLGMKTIYHTRHRLSAQEEQDYAARYATLEELLRESDFVSLHASHTPETENMINAERLALMKPTAFLINTARGGLVDEVALCDALSQRKIAGAALDVFKQEPTPKDNPLFKLDNVIFSPHIAVGSLPIEGRFRGCLDNIARVIRGETPIGVVNAA
jgi:phosphoglycerate dehydrogenase-like enzyme